MYWSVVNLPYRKNIDRFIFDRLCCGLCGLWLLVSPMPIAASEGQMPPRIAWKEGDYTYLAKSVMLAKIFRDVASSFGLTAQLSPGCLQRSRVVVDGKLTAPSPSDFLDQLAQAYGITWHAYDGILYCDAPNEQTTASLSVSESSVASLHRSLASLGVLDPRFGWGEIPEQSLVMVSGPRSYVERVKRAVAGLSLSPVGQEVVVIRLNHAFASDRVVALRDRNIVTPGVVTILRNLVLGSSASQTIGTNAQLANGIGQLSSLGPVAGEASKTEAPPKDQASAGASSRLRRPGIEADVRLNAVIIKDVPEALPVYERLVALLDVETPLLEIDALIIDVDSDKLKELGIDWTFRSGNLSAGSNQNGATGALSMAMNAFPPMAMANGASLVLSKTGEFLARVRMLENMGHANVMSKPSILTLENLGAIIDLSETFYARVQSVATANVIPVSAGTMLRVTPHLVNGEDASRIQLSVDIEDGTVLTNKQVDNLPTVRNSSVSTNAIVGDRQSLLIGGYSKDTEEDIENKVPVLGDIPYLGWFFKYSRTEHKKRERVFLITPRVVSIPDQGKPSLDLQGQ